MPNIQIIYETDEEAGGSFTQVLPELVGKGVLQKPDSVLISDTEFEGDFPAITYKLRGLVRIWLTLQTADVEVHSGTCGGIAENPLETIIQLFPKFKDKKGNVLVPGFYDSITALTEEEKNAAIIAGKNLNLAKFKKDVGLWDLVTSDPEEFYLNTWHKPTFEIHGFEGVQYKEDEIKTAIPYKATAKITMRLVPGQNPDDIIKKFKDHVAALDPRIEVKGDGVPGWVSPLENPFMRAAEKACAYGFGKKALFVGCGGAIGAVSDFENQFDVPIVLIAQSLLSDGYHAPNEHFRYSQASKAMATMAKYITSIANLRS